MSFLSTAQNSSVSCLFTPCPMLICLLNPSVPPLHSLNSTPYIFGVLTHCSASNTKHQAYNEENRDNNTEEKMETKQTSKVKSCRTLPWDVISSKNLYMSRKQLDSWKESTPNAMKKQVITSQQIHCKSMRRMGGEVGKNHCELPGHCQGEVNELDEPLAWFNASVRTLLFFFLIIHLDYLPVCFNLSTVSIGNCTKKTNGYIHHRISRTEVGAAVPGPINTEAWDFLKGLSERAPQGVSSRGCECVSGCRRHQAAEHCRAKHSPSRSTAWALEAPCIIQLHQPPC